MQKTVASLAALSFFFSASVAMPADNLASQPVLNEQTTANWSGFFFGGSIGFASVSGDFSARYNGLNNTSAFYNENASSNGGLVGGQFGYDWQFSNFVVGLSAKAKAVFSESSTASFEFDAPDSSSGNGGHNDQISVAEGPNASSKLSYNITGLASLPIKIGFLTDELTLLYVTGGLAGAFVNSEFHGGYNYSENSFVHGYVLGVGAERMVSERASFFLEANYYDFEELTEEFEGIVEEQSTQEFSFDPSIWEFSVGLNYRF